MEAISSILLSLSKPFQDELITESGLKLFIDPTYQPEWNATTTAKIEYVPKSLKEMGLKKGDDVAISFRVVSSREYYASSDSDFMPTTTGSELFREWVNHKNQRLTAICFMKYTGFVECSGFFSDNDGLIDSINGSQNNIEKWLTQFSFSKPEGFKFNNIVEIDGAALWRARASDILAKKDGDTITPLTSSIMGMPIDIDLTQRVKIVNGVSLPDNSVNGRFSDRCIAVVGYPDYGIDEGDILMFDKEYVQEYTLWGKDYFFIPPEFVHGKLEKIESK
ncbi:MAG: hypothetical protein JSS67_07650 [Bacteroidetes bacterium]|nr:hypothetical protein [Bacteroidota bacterium]